MCGCDPSKGIYCERHKPAETPTGVIVGDPPRDPEVVHRSWVWKSMYDAQDSALDLTLEALDAVAECSTEPGIAAMCRIVARSARAMAVQYA